MIGLIEQEWLDTLATLDSDEVRYTDFVKKCRTLAGQLRAEEAVDLVVAVTHMRIPNDVRLAIELAGVVDLILGGHDHSYVNRTASEHGTTLVKSGTDFCDLTQIKVIFPTGFDDSGPRFEFKRHPIMSDLPEDPAVSKLVHQFNDSMEAQMDKLIGDTAVDLEARFSMIRTRETNLGNFVVDAIREGCRADVALINSGTFRADRVIPAGPLRHRDLVILLPLIDHLTVLSLTGEQLLAALENGVSKYPMLEGRFPQVSGVSFEFDPRLPPGARVAIERVFVGGQPLVKDRQYSVAVKEYLAQGKDGYSIFLKGKVIRDSEDCPVLPTLLRNTFKAIRVLNCFSRTPSPLPKSQSALLLGRLWKEKAVTGGAIDRTGVEDLLCDSVVDKTAPPVAAGKPVRFKICPELEGRIICLAPP